MTPRFRTVGLVVLTLAGCTVAGCASSRPSPPSQAPPPPSTASTASTSTLNTLPPRSSRPVSSISAATTTPPTTLARTTTVPSSAPCSLRIDVLRGSGISGQQFARITYTNIGPTTCLLAGPGEVTLRAGGRQIGGPATGGAPATALRLAPDAAARTQLTDYSTCSAPNSDTIRIVPPGPSGAVERPIVLRGCRLVLSPLA